MTVERWPGAFTMAAKSMGKTTEEFNKLIASGQIMTKDFLPGFLEFVSKSTKESGAYAAALKKVSTAQGQMIVDFQIAMKQGFESGQGGFISFFRDLSLVIRENTGLFKAFGRVFGGVASILGGFLKFISPMVGLVSDSFNVLGEAIGDAMNPKKGWGDLTGIEKAFRVIGIAILDTTILFDKISLAVAKFQRFIGDTEDDMGETSRQVFALGMSLLSLLLVARSLIGVLGWLIKPLKSLKGLTGKTAAKGVNDLAKSYGNLASQLGKAGSAAQKATKSGAFGRKGQGFKASPPSSVKTPSGGSGIGATITGALKGLGIGYIAELIARESIYKWAASAGDLTGQGIQNLIGAAPDLSIYLDRDMKRSSSTPNVKQEVTVNVHTKSTDAKGIAREFEKVPYQNLLVVAQTSSP